MAQGRIAAISEMLIIFPVSVSSTNFLLTMMAEVRLVSSIFRVSSKVISFKGLLAKKAAEFMSMSGLAKLETFLNILFSCWFDVRLALTAMAFWPMRIISSTRSVAAALFWL